MLTIAFSVVTILITMAMMKILGDQINQGNDNYYRLGERELLSYPLICIFAGIIAGSSGLGGGLIKSPLLLEILDDSVEASVTSSTMIFFTSITAFIGYSINKDINSGDSLFLTMFFVGIVFTVIGQKLTDFLIRKTDK